MDKLFSFKLQAKTEGESLSILAISTGEAKGHGLTFSKTVLQNSLSLWDGVPCMLDHNWMPSVTRLAGIMKNPTWDENEKGVRLDLTPSGPGAQVVKDLQAAIKADPALSKIVGFSAVLSLSYKHTGEVTKVNTVYSVDCVIDPARGGKFLSAHPTYSLERRKSMKKKPNPAAPEDEIEGTEEFASDEIDETAARLQGASDHVAALQSANVEGTRVLSEICTNLLNASLSSSKLPASVVTPIRNRMEKQIKAGKLEGFSEALSAEITEARSMLSELTASDTVQGPSRLSSFATSGDQFSAAIHDLMGCPRPEGLAKLKTAPLSGIREMYILGTGDKFFHGGYDPEAIHMFATSASLPNLLADVLNKMVHDNWNKFADKGYGWWRNIVTVEHSNSLQDVKGILLGQTDILPTVDEGDGYDELEIVDSKESAAWLKKGAYLGLTLEMFLKDDTRKLRAFPRIIGKAGIRTISAWVASKFTENSGAGAAMADGGALFNATAVTTTGGHANLRTTALSADEWEAISAAMYNQPMLAPSGADGGIMAVEPAFCLVPRALKKTAWDLFKNEWMTTSNVHATNLLKDTATPIVVPEFTDTNNFAAVADPDVAPAITVTEIFGLEPEIFVAGSQMDAAMFLNDESRIKARHFANVLVEDFRPLHKSNVA